LVWLGVGLQILHKTGGKNCEITNNSAVHYPFVSKFDLLVRYGPQSHRIDKLSGRKLEVGERRSLASHYTLTSGKNVHNMIIINE